MSCKPAQGSGMVIPYSYSHDLNQEDLRFKLLSYYQNPGQTPLGALTGSVARVIRKRCGSTDQRRSYRVVVQFEPLGSGGKRVDLVVEGERTRLAIECDGIGGMSDEYEKDMFRQRQLERAGLVFWRIRGLDLQKSFCSTRSTVGKLSEMGIEPWTFLARSLLRIIPI